MKVISHRGIAKGCPENTLEAFHNAIELGVDGIETDVRITSDDELILFHDRRIDGVKITQLTRKDISKKIGFDVPKLKYLLQEIHEPILLNLEIKCRSAVSIFLNLINKFQDKKYLISSSWHSVIKQVNYFNLPCGPIMSCCPEDLTRTYGGNIIWNWEFFDCEYLPLFPNKRHYLYGIDNELIDYEIEGVITDYPRFHLEGQGKLTPI